MRVVGLLGQLRLPLTPALSPEGWGEGADRRCGWGRVVSRAALAGDAFPSPQPSSHGARELDRHRDWGCVVSRAALAGDAFPSPQPSPQRGEGGDRRCGWGRVVSRAALAGDAFPSPQPSPRRVEGVGSALWLGACGESPALATQLGQFDLFIPTQDQPAVLARVGPGPFAEGLVERADVGEAEPFGDVGVGDRGVCQP